jgi:histone chaperone ASF1
LKSEGTYIIKLLIRRQMAFVNITNVIVDNNPAPFLTQFKFHITFECLKEMPDTLEWRLIYIGSAKDESHDQVVDSF